LFSREGGEAMASTPDEKCAHDYRVVDSVSDDARKTGRSAKYARWFELGEDYGVAIRTVRRLKCSDRNCGKKRISLEIFGRSFERLTDQLDSIEELKESIVKKSKKIRDLKVEVKRLKAEVGKFQPEKTRGSKHKAKKAITETED
jgi:uncharacterized coiled-coil protein SlyX